MSKESLEAIGEIANVPWFSNEELFVQAIGLFDRSWLSATWIIAQVHFPVFDVRKRGRAHIQRVISQARVIFCPELTFVAPVEKL